MEGETCEEAEGVVELGAYWEVELLKSDAVELVEFPGLAVDISSPKALVDAIRRAWWLLLPAPPCCTNNLKVKRRFLEE